MQTKEIIFLNTDKRIYLSGEEIWVSIKNVNAYSHKLSVLSKIAYVELYSNEKKSAVVKKMIRLSEGMGSAVIQIPPGLESGYYMLRAYTIWMKNFSKSHYSTCIIPIVNPLVKTFEFTSDVLDFKFYPESGQLVPGIPNRIFYSILSQNEIKSGIVIDKDNNLITTFEMNNIDIGSFTFIPEKNEYKIIITDELDSTFYYSLPAIRRDHSHLSIHQDSSFIEINVVQPELSTKKLLEIEKFDSVFYLLELNNSERNHTIKVDKTKIPYGISMVNLKDLTGKKLCARPILNIGETNRLSCVTDKSQYHTREKVEVNLESTMGSLLSISIKNRLHQSSLREIELLPLIFSKKTYFNNWYGSSIDYRSWEAYLVLNTDTLISIHNDDKGKPVTNLPEYNGHVIEGKVIPFSIGTGNGRELSLTVKGDPFAFYTSAISKDNFFCFSVNDLPVNSAIILCDKSGDSSGMQEMTINDPFTESIPEDSFPSLFITNELLSYLEKANLNNQLKYAFSINSQVEYKDTLLPRSMKYFLVPDDVYILDDYTRFPVMEEVFREIIKKVYVRKNRGNFSFKVLDNENDEFFSQNPLILIDGLPIFDVNKLMKINPLLIESIEIVNSVSFVGKSAFYGVINLNSYKSDYADYEIDHNYNEIDYYPIEDYAHYLSSNYADHDAKHSRIPDFRTLLYWQPDIRIKQGILKKIEFYTSDDEGVYEIEITGINKDGSPLSIKSYFEVVHVD